MGPGRRRWMLRLLALGVSAPWRAQVGGMGWSWGFRFEGEKMAVEIAERGRAGKIRT